MTAEWPVSNADYHADRTRISASGIKKFIASIEDFEREYIQGIKKAITPATQEALDIGTALHLKLFEPESYADSVCTMPKFDLRKKGKDREDGKSDKELKDEWLAVNAGKLQLTEEAHENVLDMGASLRLNPRAKDLIERTGMSEQSYTFEFEYLPFKVRFDRLTRIEPLAEGELWKPDTFIDVKTCQGSMPEEFSKHFLNMNYHVQAFIYREGFKAVFGEYPAHVIYIAFDKNNPHRAPVDYELGPEFLELARWRVLKALEDLETCRLSGDWTGRYVRETQVLKPPYWALKAMEREIEDG